MFAINKNKKNKKESLLLKQSLLRSYVDIILYIITPSQICAYRVCFVGLHGIIDPFCFSLLLFNMHNTS